MRIYREFRQCAAAAPDRIAIEADGRMVSYAEFAALVETIGANLCHAGIAPGDLVAVMLPRTTEHGALLFALGAVGAGIVPLRMEPASVASHHLRGLNVRALVTATGNELMPERQLHLETLCRPPAGSTPLAPVEDETLPLLMGQSSGTTGDPKRFLLSRHQVWLRIDETRRLFDMRPGNVAYLELEMGFFQGALAVFTQFSSGATGIVANPGALEDYVHLLEEKQVITAFFMPQRLQRLLAFAGERERPLFSRLQPMLSSAPVPARDKLLGRKYIATGLMECYASNESAYITLDLPDRENQFPDSVGKPVPGVTLQVVGDDHQPLPPGEPGLVRLQKAGGFLPTGYLDNPEATARHFHDGWYYPGDVAIINEQGYVFLQGRKDDVINRGGVKFYPLEIERVLLSHPAVQEAAVTSWPHPVFGQVPLAFVELSEPGAIGELRQLCTRELGLKAPDKIIVVREMPRNAARKILKRVLREQYAALLEKNTPRQ